MFSVATPREKEGIFRRSRQSLVTIKIVSTVGLRSHRTVTFDFERVIGGTVPSVNRLFGARRKSVYRKRGMIRANIEPILQLFCFCFTITISFPSLTCRRFHPERVSGQGVITGTVSPPALCVPSFLSHRGLRIIAAR